MPGSTSPAPAEGTPPCAEDRADDAPAAVFAHSTDLSTALRCNCDPRDVVSSRSPTTFVLGPGADEREDLVGQRDPVGRGLSLTSPPRPSEELSRAGG